VGSSRAAARTRRWACSGPLILACLLLPAPARADPRLEKSGDFLAPTYATAPPGDPARVFVTEQTGRVQLLRDGAQRTFLDVTAITLDDSSERGLLSMAFAPDYATSGRFYVYLTARAAAAQSGTPGELQVREYRRSADPDLADPASGRVLLAIRHDQAGNHNGGQLQVGPDGKLWLATGDAADGANAQDPESLLGKLIRLDPATPTPEVVASGLRNPWRFSFDRATGQLVLADVGDTAFEEVNVGVAGNYGWPCFEGVTRRTLHAGCDTGAALPVLTKDHATDGFCSITGGYVVRDPGLPTLLGRYLYSDHCVGELRTVDLAAPAGDAATGLRASNPTSFGEDACGRLLVVSLNGPVYRLLDGAPSACAPAAPPPAPGTPPPVSDTRACGVSARVSGLRSVRRLRRLTLSLRADEACRATVSGRIRGVASFRSTRRSLGAGQRGVARLRLTARGARAVRRALRRRASLRVTYRVQAVDAAGNVRTLARVARVRG
jgi:hypothetical protein